MANYWSRFTQERSTRRRLLKAGAAFSMGLGALALLGCGSDDDDETGAGPTSSAGGTSSTATPASAGQPRAGGRLGTYFSSVNNYNTVKNWHDGWRNSGITVYDRLITSRSDQRRYHLEAAENVEIAEPTRIVFTLKPGMVFQDGDPVGGRPVRASDIVATQEYVLNLPDAENSSFQRFYMDRIEAPDDQTVVLHLKQPTAYLFSSLQLGNGTAQPIIPEEMLSRLDDTPPIGSGPYQLDSHTFNAEYHWRKFPNFREAAEGRPYIEEREIISLIDEIAQETAFRGERIHFWQPPAGAVERLADELDSEKFIQDIFLATGLFNWEANTDPAFDKIWRDVRVREALYRLTNRAQILELVFASNGVVPPGPLQANLELYQLDESETEEFFREDPAEAKKLLDAATFPYDQEFESLSSSTSTTNLQSAEVWSQQLSRVGFKLRPVALPFAEWLPNRIAPGEYDLIMSSQPGGDTPQRTLRKFHSDQQESYSHMGLYDPELDALIGQSEIELDAEQNIRLVKEVQMEALRQYASFYNILTRQQSEFRNSKVKDWELNPVNSPHYQTQAWVDA